MDRLEELHVKGGGEPVVRKTVLTFLGRDFLILRGGTYMANPLWARPSPLSLLRVHYL